jgi:hypothetical protein
MKKDDLLTELIEKKNNNSNYDNIKLEDLIQHQNIRQEYIDEDEFNSIRYEIKYIKNLDLKKLEDYMTQLTIHEYGKIYEYRFIDNRENIKITSTSDGKNVIISLDEFITRIGKKLRMFLKFKDIDSK